MHQSKLTASVWARLEAQSTDVQPSRINRAKEKSRAKDSAPGVVRTTRSTEGEGPSAGCKEIESLPGQEVTDAVKGAEYLEATLLTVPGVPYTVDMFVSVLFQISMLPGVKGSWANTNAVRVVAFILAEIELEDKSKAIADTVVESLSGQLDSARQEVSAVVLDLKTTVAEAAAAAKAQVEESLGGMLEDLKTATQGANDNTVKMSETATKYRDTLLQSRLPATPAIPKLNHLAPLAPRLHARESVRARQVLIDLAAAPGSESAPLTEESVAALRERLNKALKDCDPGRRDFKARAVTRLKNGGILMELDSDEAVEWFSHQATRDSFLAKFHPSASIKPTSYQVIVQFVLLTFSPDRDIELHELEEVNGLDEGDISHARWIKAILRCAPAQTCGHAIFTLASPQVANEILAHGLFVCHKKVYAEKCKKEPLRCLKCHGWGHMARACLVERDTCGTCSQEHRTADCTDQLNWRCVPCGRAGHASWDRDCPVFQRKCGELNDRTEENGMPYFPTAEVWTQVREPPKTIYVGPPSPRVMQARGTRERGGHTQSTLPWENASPVGRSGPWSIPPPRDSWQMWLGCNDQDNLPPPPPTNI